ncbi:MAG: VWA domain-containing protein [Vicinamibacterales bacterium]
MPPFRGLFGVLLVALLLPQAAGAQDPASLPVFRSQVNLVSLAAVVRDRRGRFVSSLGTTDFQILENGRPTPVLEVHSEGDAPANIALLVDGSGSMRLNDSFALARVVSGLILDSLKAGRDEAALYSFDTRVLTLQPFTGDLAKVKDSLVYLQTWGSTSLWDAITGVAGKIHEKSESRRAIVVFTDGNDTASTVTPAEVATITSALDVPVYVFALSPSAPQVKDAGTHQPPLAELASATGGMYFVATDMTSLVAQATTVIEELRHQHVLAFEASTEPGWRSLELRVRGRGYKVRTRGWYWAGDAAMPPAASR